MQKITPFLWFEHQAEEAAEFYVSVFRARPGASPDSAEVTDVSRYGEGAPVPAGTVMTASFRLDGMEFTALNGGPAHDFTDAVSFLVSCEGQEEVDALWAALTEGGEEGPCGWLRDRYGVSWQVIPTALSRLLGDPDPARAQAAMQAMLKMKKIDIAGLERAAEAA